MNLVQHLPYCAQARTKQAKRVAELANLAAKPTVFPIVLGDLNVDAKLVKDKSLDALLKNNPTLKDPFPADT